MKKAFFAGIAVLFALAIVTCDLIPPAGTGGGGNIEYTEDGQPLVNLTIGVGDAAGRALTGENAETYTDFYEVAFKGPNGKIYRATWRAGQKGRIAVPFGNYKETDPEGTGVGTTVGAAILFAGRNNDRTLLGVGKLTHINGVDQETVTPPPPPNPYVINSETTSVTFTLEPLENGIDATASSTFLVTTTSPSAPDAAANVLIKSGDGGTITIPLFPVVPGTPAVWGPDPGNPTGPEIITDPETVTENTATWSITCPNGNGVMIQGKGTLDSVGFFTDAVNGFKIGAPSSSTDAITPITGAVSTAGTGGVFTLTFTVEPEVVGLSQLFIDIPVNALDTTAATFPEIWHIRGGLKNYEFDQGTTPIAAHGNTLGGAILIGTQAFAGPFEITGTY